MKEKLKDASRVLSKLIAKDMRNENDQYQFLNTKTVTIREFSGFKVDAKMLSDVDGYHILYVVDDGSIYAVNFYY